LSVLINILNKSISQIKTKLNNFNTNKIKFLSGQGVMNGSHYTAKTSKKD